FLNVKYNGLYCRRGGEEQVASVARQANWRNAGRTSSSSAAGVQRYVRDTCLCRIGHKHVYLADQIMPRSSLSTAFPLGKSPCHVCPTRHNPDMGCFSLFVHSRRKGEAYDRARIHTYLCDHPLATRAAEAPPGCPHHHPTPARVCP